jgi:chromosome segregation ATPase
MKSTPDHNAARPLDLTPARPDPDAQLPTCLEPTASERPPVGGALGETLVDERDDVLGVVSELEDQLDRYEEIRERLEDELNRTREQRSTAESTIQRLEWQIKAYQTQVEAHERLRQEAAALEERLADTNARTVRLGNQLEDAEKETQRLSRELSAAQSQADSLWTVQQETERLKVDLDAAQAQRAEIEQVLAEVAEDRNALRVQLQGTQAKCAELAGLNQQLEAKLRAARDNNDELRRAQDLLMGKLDQIRAERKNGLSQVAHLERENARLIERQRYHEREITSLRNKVRGAESEVAAATKAFTEVRAALLETSARTRRRSMQPPARSIAVKLRGMDEEFPVSASVKQAVP